jgi:glycosyltransferase involved in cell wall biosynthesis
MKVSIVIRAYNEEKYLGQLLEGIRRQDLPDDDVELILVDSGSTDQTVSIASRFGARIVNIRKEDFTFGRSLNMGCEAASGDVLVMVSAHCIPVNESWLSALIAPLRQGVSPYCYGRQVGWGSSKFSECQLFKKYYPDVDKLQSKDFFCNNANSALLKSTWESFPFDEELTGLEDMDLGHRLVRHGQAIAYVAGAAVHHIHEEVWSRVKTRYEREAIALQLIMPQVHVGFPDFLRYFVSAVFFDFEAAIQEKKFRACFTEIILFRFFQFWGSYKGHQSHRQMSRQMKEQYFYPK